MGNEWGDGYTAGQTGLTIALKTAATLERKRIIKLLEADSVGYCNCKWGINELDSGELVDVQEFICDPHRYIALIKGENK